MPASVSAQSVAEVPEALRDVLAEAQSECDERVEVVGVIGFSMCCRASDDTCVDCGYAACTEITESLRLRRSALLGMVRYW